MYPNCCSNCLQFIWKSFDHLWGNLLCSQNVIATALLHCLSTLFWSHILLDIVIELQDCVVYLLLFLPGVHLKK